MPDLKSIELPPDVQAEVDSLDPGDRALVMNIKDAVIGIAETAARENALGDDLIARSPAQDAKNRYLYELYGWAMKRHAQLTMQSVGATMGSSANGLGYADLDTAGMAITPAGPVCKTAMCEPPLDAFGWKKGSLGWEWGKLPKHPGQQFLRSSDGSDVPAGSLVNHTLKEAWEGDRTWAAQWMGLYPARAPLSGKCPPGWNAHPVIVGFITLPPRPLSDAPPAGPLLAARGLWKPGTVPSMANLMKITWQDLINWNEKDALERYSNNSVLKQAATESGVKWSDTYGWYWQPPPEPVVAEYCCLGAKDIEWEGKPQPGCRQGVVGPYLVHNYIWCMHFMCDGMFDKIGREIKRTAKRVGDEIARGWNRFTAEFKRFMMSPIGQIIVKVVGSVLTVAGMILGGIGFAMAPVIFGALSFAVSLTDMAYKTVVMHDMYEKAVDQAEQQMYVEVG
ncbi:MAG: hypothetical protein ABH877_01715, partial [bacterium]